MSYNPTTWVDRVVDRPRTYNVQNNADGTITLVPAPGTIHEPGTPVNAVNMNKIEQGIAAAARVDTANIFTQPQTFNASPFLENVLRSNLLGTGNTQVINPVAGRIYVGNPTTELVLETSENNIRVNIGGTNRYLLHNGNLDTYNVARTNVSNAFTSAQTIQNLLRLTATAESGLIQAGANSSDSNARLRVARNGTTSTAISLFEIFANAVTINGQNVATEGRENVFTQDQILDKAVPQWTVRARHTGGAVSGLAMQSADGTPRWIAGYSPVSGDYVIWDNDGAMSQIVIKPNGGRTELRGKVHTGSQTNANYYVRNAADGNTETPPSGMLEGDVYYQWE